MAITNEGILNVQTPDQVTAEEEREERKKQARRVQQTSLLTDLSSHIRSAWENARDAKSDIETRLLRCLRQRKGEYDPEVLDEIAKMGGSKAYMMLTGVKCRAAESWIRDVLQPHGDKPWTLEPTPMPDLPPQIQMMVVQKIQQQMIMQMQQSGMVPSPELIQQQMGGALQKAKEELVEEAKRLADRMALKIEDQLVEGGWTASFDDVIRDIVTFPCGFLKGPVIRHKKVLKWEMAGKQQAKPTIGDDFKIEFDRVSPFDIYPSPSSRDVNDGYLIQRHRLTLRDLEELIGVPGYDEQAIRLVVEEYGRGGLRDWMWVQDSARAEVEDRSHEQMAPGETIDAIEYWGYVHGSFLEDWDVKPMFLDWQEVDPAKAYPINAWLIGDYVIKASHNPDPLGDKPYYKASYEKIPGSFWGLGVPELMRDIQGVCNACARSIVNNMGISSGPQVSVDVGRIDAEETPDDIYPWKLWSVTDKPGMQRSPVEFFAPPSTVQELLAIYQYFSQRADDYTGIPAYTYGSPYVGGAGKTASGLSMLMNAASKGMKGVIANIDRGIIEPAIRSIWLHNMLYDEDQSIKGDIQVKARGAAALMVKEQESMKLAQMLQMLANPIDQELIGPLGRAELLREMLSNANIDPAKIVPPNDAIKTMMEKMAKAKAEQATRGEK